MKLMTQELKQHIPALRATEHEADPIVWVKFFTPWTYWTWYATEFDGKDLFFGYVKGEYPELGYFSLAELESIQGPWGLQVERDLYFVPRRLSEVKAGNR